MFESIFKILSSDLPMILHYRYCVINDSKRASRWEEIQRREQMCTSRKELNKPSDPSSVKLNMDTMPCRKAWSSFKSISWINILMYLNWITSVKSLVIMILENSRKGFGAALWRCWGLMFDYLEIISLYLSTILDKYWSTRNCGKGRNLYNSHRKGIIKKQWNSIHNDIDLFDLFYFRFIWM